MFNRNLYCKRKMRIYAKKVNEIVLLKTIFIFLQTKNAYLRKKSK